MRQVCPDTEEVWSGPPLTSCEPERLTSAAVFSSPHSGRRYPAAFIRGSRLDPGALRASEDAFVELLFRTAPAFGAPLIAAEFPRAFLDANRAEDELDPLLIEGVPKRGSRSLRVAAGLGVVPRIVAEGVPIYAGKVPLAEAQIRIARCHRPYHKALESALQRAQARFGQALLIDCHSMPSDRTRFAARRAEIVLGDCYGSAASAVISDAAFEAFRDAGFRVARNVPFAGGYITQRYGCPRFGLHAIQVEIDRTLYLDQRRVEPNARFDDTRRALEPAIARLAGLLGDSAAMLAAE